jgi:hypothetical protein
MDKTELAILIALVLILYGLLYATVATPMVHNMVEAVYPDSNNYNVDYRIVVYDIMTNHYTLTVEGKCLSTKSLSNVLEIKCKVGKDLFKTQYINLTTNMGFFIQEVMDLKVGDAGYNFIFEPEVLRNEPCVR